MRDPDRAGGVGVGVCGWGTRLKPRGLEWPGSPWEPAGSARRWLSLPQGAGAPAAPLLSGDGDRVGDGAGMV